MRHRLVGVALAGVLLGIGVGCGSASDTQASLLDFEATKLCFQHDTQAMVDPVGAGLGELVPEQYRAHTLVARIPEFEGDGETIGDGAFLLFLYVGDHSEDVHSARDAIGDTISASYFPVAPDELVWSDEKANVAWFSYPIATGSPVDETTQATITGCLQEANT